MLKTKYVMLVMSKKVEVELGPDLQEDFESFLAVCQSLDIKPRVNSFLYYVSNFGTYQSERSKDGSNGI
jgi:hypothetical protein